VVRRYARLFDTLTAFCTANNVRQSYIPMFIAGFAEAEIVDTCEKLADPIQQVQDLMGLGAPYVRVRTQSDY
jgi:hypothetical protein